MIKVIESADYPHHALRPDAKVVAVMFEDNQRYLPDNVHGPRQMVRTYKNVVVFAEGATVMKYSKEERIMSDVWDYVNYAVAMTPDGQFETVRMVNFDVESSVEVDANEAVLALHRAHCQAVQMEGAKAAAKREAEIAAERAKEPAKGKTIVVVRGRKVPKGTKGVCFWMGSSYYGTRLGLKTDSGETVWVDARNCEAVAA